MKDNVLKTLRNLWLTIYLVAYRIYSAIAKASTDVFQLVTGNAVEWHKDTRLRQVQEMTDKETFEYWTGVLGYQQRTNPQWKDGIEKDLWAMAAAYKKGKIKQFIKEKIETPMYTMHDLQYDGKTAKLVNTETGEEKVIEAEAKDTEVVNLPIESDQ